MTIVLTRFFLACSAIFLLVAVTTNAFAAGPESAAALQATNYIRSLQNADGGFPAFGADSSPSTTLEAVFSFSAYGVDARTVENGTNGPDDYLADQVAGATLPAGAVAKLAAGLAAMDIDPASFAGMNVLSAMEANYDPATGKYGDDVFAQSLFMLAEVALDRTVPSMAADYLQSLQLIAGGWEFSSGWGADTNSTALALRALIAAGVPASDPDIAGAIGYLHATQQADGGFPYSVPGDSDPNSTAYVIQAIVAVGQSAEAGGPWDLGGNANPLHALVGFQNPATGALQFFGSDNPFATYQGVPGLMLAAFPEQFDPDAVQPTPTETATDSPTATATATTTISATATGISRSSNRAPASTVTTAPVAAVSTPESVPTRVSTVLAGSAQPNRPTGVTALPSAGSGAEHSASGVAMLAFALSGAALVAAGLASRGRTSER